MDLKLHDIVEMKKEHPCGSRLTWFLEDYGDILVATVGLLSILISYYLSWKYIAKNNLKNSNSFKRGAPLMRYLAMGVALLLAVLMLATLIVPYLSL